MEWTEETISRLRELWAEGLSTAEIGRRLSITKNAVVGKAHRLGLPPRPSPIRRSEKKPVAEATKAIPAEAPVTDKPDAIAAKAPVTADAPPKAIDEAVKPVSAVAPPAPQPEAAPKAAVAAKPEKPAAAPRAQSRSKPALSRISDAEPKKRRGPSCCWPIGDPGTPGFHFCGATPLPGKPYCAEHAQIAYVKLRDRRDNVA
ncbi:MAG: GcrA family cell cycle regulator [Acetobacter cibinongensis]